jgi:hypothetical protein
MKRAYVNRDFMRDVYEVHLGEVGPNGTFVARSVELVFDRLDSPITTPPFLSLDEDSARVLFDALGVALNIYTPDARMAAEVLKREQDRVDKMIVHLTGGGDAA